MMVYSGDQQKTSTRLRIMQVMALKLGVIQMWIPLNGSSEDREESIAFWKMFATNWNVPIRVNSKHSIVLG